MKRTLQIISVLIVFLWIAQAFALDASEASMQALRGKIKPTDKKILVGKNMKLTDKEEKDFWPIYESYQKDLNNIIIRSGMQVNYYAKEYINGSLTDKKAKKLIKDYLYIEEDLFKLKKSNLKKLSRVLPGKKLITYIQLENKIQAIIQFEWAALIPLAE